MESNKKGATDKPGSSVRAVERALDILLAFSVGDIDLTAADLLTRVDLTRPTLYRLLYTLEQKGFISAEGDPQKFSLGPSVGKLSRVWSSNIDVSQCALPIMREIWRHTGETVALFVPQDSVRVCVAEIPSTHPLGFRLGIGYSERIVLGASGRALLAWLDPTEQELQEYCEGLSTTPEDLRRKLAGVREKGYASSQNELRAGAAAVAVPFFRNDGKVLGSIGVFGPSARIDHAHLEQIAAYVVKMARKLSASLGYIDGSVAPASPKAGNL